jgi:hypothetical protein
MADVNVTSPTTTNDVPEFPTPLGRACWISSRVRHIASLVNSYAPDGDDPNTSELVRMIGLAKAELAKCQEVFQTASEDQIPPTPEGSGRLETMSSDVETKLFAAIACAKVLEVMDWEKSEDLAADGEYLFYTTTLALHSALERLYCAVSDIHYGRVRNEARAH